MDDEDFPVNGSALNVDEGNKMIDAAHQRSNCELSPGRFLQGIVAAVVTALLYDLGVYRGYGGAGWAFFLCGATLVYFIGTIGKKSLKSSWVIAFMLLLLSYRLVWLGTPWLCFLGLILLPTFAMSRNGFVPYLIDILVYVSMSLLSGPVNVLKSSKFVSLWNRQIKLPTVLAYGLPVAAVFVFGLIFIAANPDLSKSISLWMQTAEKWLHEFLLDFDVGEIVLVCAVAWLALGQLCPIHHSNTADIFKLIENRERDQTSQEAALYLPIRNTLLAVIGLFLLYLLFEFRTLWFREFPEGFYYAGYAHQGAAWLTFALALATVMLSMIFQGKILVDPRLEKLKRLAWIWSAANFLLAMAVYNRMWIYIDFNGMTRMRIVELFGFTTVIVGFLLVVWKIRQNRSFVWLIQRQLWALGIAIFILSITPVDFLIHSYNTSEILAGNLAPAVQITEHPVDASGWLALVPLLDSEDRYIRAGVRAKLAEYLNREGKLYAKSRDPWSRNQDHWTATQIVQQKLHSKIIQSEERLAPYQDSEIGDDAWQELKEYAYQWY